MNKLKEELKNGKLQNIYLLYGEEEYLKKVYEKKITDKAVSSDMRNMNFDIFDGKDFNSQKIIDAAQTAPFFNDFRLIEVKNSELFVKGRKDESEKIAEFIEKIPDSTILLFIESKVDKRSKIFKTVEKYGKTAYFQPLSENEIIKWIKKIFLDSGKNISNSDIVYFLRTVGSDMETIFAESEKLISYCDSESISASHIDNICIKSVESGIFDLVAAIGNKNSARAIEIYLNLIAAKQAPLMILTMIARQFRLLLQTKYLSEKGMYSEEIAKTLGARNFIIKECLLQSKNFKKRFLLSAVNECLKTDIDIKTGIMDEKIAVEILIVKYSG